MISLPEAGAYSALKRLAHRGLSRLSEQTAYYYSFLSSIRVDNIFARRYSFSFGNAALFGSDHAEALCCLNPDAE